MDITVNADSISFRVRVQPRASRDALEGEHAGSLKVRLTAPPVEGRANEAERLNLPVSAVRIVSGENRRNKRVAVAGITREQVLALC